MFRGVYQSGYISLLYSLNSKPLELWDSEVVVIVFPLFAFQSKAVLSIRPLLVHSSERAVERASDFCLVTIIIMTITISAHGRTWMLNRHIGDMFTVRKTLNCNLRCW